MPFARLTLVPLPAPDAAQDLAARLTALIARALGKRHDLTSVLVEAPVAQVWTVAGVRQQVAAMLEVRVTAGTNTGAEKAAFIAGAMALLRKALPGLDPASYVLVTELPATDWGYDGRTQADRRLDG